MAEGINAGGHKFTDRHSNEWDVTITLNEAWRVDKAEFDGVTDVDICFTRPNEDMLPELIGNSQLMFAVMWYVIEPQADERELNYEQFCSGIDGSCIWEAHMAFMEALQDFFPDARTVLLPLTTLLKKKLAESEALAPKAMEEVTAAMEKAMAKYEEEARAKAKAAREKLGTLST